MKGWSVLTVLAPAAYASAVPAAPPPIVDVDGRCFIAGDVVFLQDTTGSFMDDMPVVHDQIPAIIAQVAQEFPGTLFGIAEFRDKPYYPLGELNDFCYKLRYGELTANAEMLQFAWDILEPSGGGDLYEAHYQAGIDVVLDENIGWRPFIDGAYNVTLHQPGDATKLAAAVRQWETGAVTEAGARVVVMITDAEPHIPGDMTMCAPGAPGWDPTWYCPQNLPANPGTILDGDTEIACRDYDYPSEQQFVKTALENNVVFIFLTTADVAPFYRRLNEQVFKNPPSFHQTISNNSSNLGEALLNALRAISEVGCENMPTTTTTTTVPTTAEAVVTTVGPPQTITAVTTTTQTVVPTQPVATTTTTQTIITTTTTPMTTAVITTTPAAVVTTVGTPETTAVTTLPATTTASAVTEGTPECPPCPACPSPPCAPCGECHHHHPVCAHGCDDLVIKVGASIAKLDLSYEN